MDSRVYIIKFDNWGFMVNLMNKIQILRKISQTLFFVRALIVTGFYLSIVGFIKRFIIGDRILATIITKIIAIVLAFIAGRVFVDGCVHLDFYLI